MCESSRAARSRLARWLARPGARVSSLTNDASSLPLWTPSVPARCACGLPPQQRSANALKSHSMLKKLHRSKNHLPLYCVAGARRSQNQGQVAAVFLSMENHYEDWGRISSFSIGRRCQSPAPIHTPAWVSHTLAVPLPRRGERVPPRLWYASAGPWRRVRPVYRRRCHQPVGLLLAHGCA